ncbi:folate transporter 1-like [Sipha flava]|uniref:Folate transporter 1 n=1 Tax=Sipha flava TaxID=143950 RepID=A0A2S2QA61_9HEMI|nr:folate transporter 1-like [Sipha flava]
MHSWTTIIALVVVFIFAVEFRPLDYFMTTYLTSPRLNITLSQATDELAHLRDYSNILSILVITIITDYLLYKPVLLFNVFCGILFYVNLVMLPNFIRLKVFELFGAFFIPHEVVYLSYLFARVHDKRYYQATSGLARTAMLLGKFCSSVFAQTLLFTRGKSYVKDLPCFTLGSVVFAFVWASFLPPVRRRNYKDDVIAKLMVNNNNEQSTTMNEKLQPSSKSISRQMWKNLNESYKNLIVLKWSIWYCLGLVGYMIINMSFLSHEFGENEQVNGVVESLTMLIGAVSSYKIGVRRVNWELKCNAFIGSGTLILGMCVIFCYFHQQMLSVQLSYILFGSLIQAMFVISWSEIAKQLKNKCYALIMCFNTFISLVVLLCYKELFIRGNIFQINIPEQVLLFGSTYIIIGIIYLIPCGIEFKRSLENSCSVYDVSY